MQRLYLTIAIICVAHILGMVPFAMYPTLIPTLQAEWSASNTEIGWVAGIYFGGYLVAVTFLVPLTDRVDPRKIYLFSMVLTTIVPLAFAFGTFGVPSASLWRFLQGVGLAGTYMPGLKAMVDAVPDRIQSRTVAVYTMCFGVGVAVSFMIAGILVTNLTWQWVFAASGIGPLIALGLAWVFLPRGTPKETAEKFTLIPDFRPVLKNRKALGFSIAYGVHNVELFVFRSWAVAFLFFAMTQKETGTFGSNWNPAFIVACATVIAQPFQCVHQRIRRKIQSRESNCVRYGTFRCNGYRFGVLCSDVNGTDCSRRRSIRDPDYRGLSLNHVSSRQERPLLRTRHHDGDAFADRFSRSVLRSDSVWCCFGPCRWRPDACRLGTCVCCSCHHSHHRTSCNLAYCQTKLKIMSINLV